MKEGSEGRDGGKKRERVFSNHTRIRCLEHIL